MASPTSNRDSLQVPPPFLETKPVTEEPSQPQKHDEFPFTASDHPLETSASPSYESEKPKSPKASEVLQPVPEPTTTNPVDLPPAPAESKEIETAPKEPEMPATEPTKPVEELPAKNASPEQHETAPVIAPAEPKQPEVAPLSMTESHTEQAPERVSEPESKPAPATVPQFTLSRKDKLRILFLLYADVSEESGASSLKQRQFYRLLCDSKLIEDPRVGRSKVEVLFKTCVGRKDMTFDDFAASILKLAEFSYRDLFLAQKAQAAEKIIAEHLLPLYEQLARTDDKGQDQSILATIQKLIYDKSVKVVLNSAVPALQTMYRSYIGTNMIAARNEEQVLRQITKDLFFLLHDVDLFQSNFVPRQTVALMLNLLVSTPNELITHNTEDPKVFYDESAECGATFTFGRFVVFVFWAAVVGFDAMNQQQKFGSAKYSQSGKSHLLSPTIIEKVFYLLSKMEFSKGLYKRHPHSPHSFVPPVEIIKEFVKHNPWNARPTEETKDAGPAENDAEVSDCTEKLQRLFLSYCPVSATSNTNMMPMYKYLAFLKDCGIVDNKVAALPVSATESTTTGNFPWTKRSS